MSNWITDRTQADVDRVKALAEKAKSGTWTEEEQEEWASGMKGALSYLDYSRIEDGIQEIGDILDADVSIKKDWSYNGYLTVEDAERWIRNIEILRARCNGADSTPSTPEKLDYLHFTVINQVEQILLDVETLAKDRLLYCSEPICGGEPYYALC